MDWYDVYWTLLQHCSISIGYTYTKFICLSTSIIDGVVIYLELPTKHYFIWCNSFSIHQTKKIAKSNFTFIQCSVCVCKVTVLKDVKLKWKHSILLKSQRNIIYFYIFIICNLMMTLNYYTLVKKIRDNVSGDPRTLSWACYILSLTARYITHRTVRHFYLRILVLYYPWV